MTYASPTPFTQFMALDGKRVLLMRPRHTHAAPGLGLWRVTPLLQHMTAATVCAASPIPHITGILGLLQAEVLCSDAVGAISTNEHITA
jgi:hypothetical protein